MRMVIDCSATMPLCFDDEDSRYAESVFEALDKDQGVVPAIWWYEVRNVLMIAERRRRMTAAKTNWLLPRLQKLPVRVEWAAPANEIVELARARGLTLYDAAYLELAKRENCPLATADQRVRAAAGEMGLDLFEG